MQVFERIAEQLEAVDLPLFAVTLTALPRANTPVLLILHWHGFRADPGPPGRAPGPVPRRPVPGSALQLNPPWQQLERLDGDMLDAAWRLGAWELDREERRGCDTIGASQSEALECRQAFGVDAVHDEGAPTLLGEAPDQPQMLQLAARVGYVRWQFRPVRGGLWRDTAADDTLAADGGRVPPCPVPARAPVGASRSRLRVRLGRSARILLP